MEIAKKPFNPDALKRQFDVSRLRSPEFQMNQEKPPMKTMWVNVYQDAPDDAVRLDIHAFTTEKKAKDRGHKFLGYLCTCPIEIPDLEASRD